MRTYIQSGNVIFRAPRKVAAGLAKAVSQQIAARFGLRVPVVLPERNPFLETRST